MHVVRSSPEAVDEEASAAAGSGTVKKEEMKKKKRAKQIQKKVPLQLQQIKKKRELLEGYNRC